MSLSPLTCSFFFFFFNDTATTEIYTLSLHDALPIYPTRPALVVEVAQSGLRLARGRKAAAYARAGIADYWIVDLGRGRSEEHTSELQSRLHLVCRLLLEKKKTKKQK